MNDDVQKNATSIAVLQTQVTTVMEDIKEIKVNTSQHEKNDVARFDKTLEKMDAIMAYIQKEHEEIRKELAEVKAQQKVDKVRLGTLITILASIGSVILKLIVDGLSHLIR